MNLTGVWQDKNAVYYIRSPGSSVWWLSEERNLAWVHAFRGTLQGNHLQRKPSAVEYDIINTN